jgi:hypothetical protein
LRWELEWGAEIKTLLEHYRTTGNVPPALQRRPKLDEVDRYYLDIFWELTGSRPMGENFGPIPESEYTAYYWNNGITSQVERARIKRCLRPLDTEYVKQTHEKRQRELDKHKKASGGSRPA